MSDKKLIKEEFTNKELEAIRNIIRSEMAEVFFDLYRKRSVWKS